MSHFTRNGWWTLVLVLVLAFSSVAVVMPSAVVHAADYIDDPEGGGTGGNTGFGDPDVPVGAAKHTLPQSYGRGVMVGSARAAGDGGELGNPRMWRLQTLVLLLRGYAFRF